MFCVSQVCRIPPIVRSSANQIRVKFGISRFSFSKSQILQNSVGISLQFRASCFFDSRFYSTENSVQNSDRSNLGSVSFLEIVNSPNFVDKTLFIEKVLQCGPKNLLITAPRRFGKSINLDMLRCFLANPNHYDLFSLLKVGRTPVMRYCGVFPVLWLNFKRPGSIDSYERAVAVCRDIIREAFSENEFLTSSPKLSDSRKDYCKIWCDPLRYEALSENQVRNGLRELAECLYIHNGRKSYLLIDEYDAICTASFTHVDSNTLDRIIELYRGIVGSVIKQNAKFVERSVITGILRVMCAGLSSPVNNVVDYPFSEDPEFSDYYGITDNEFNELLKRECNASIAHLREDALHFYNGYEWNGRRILNTWSVMNFVEKKQLASYWVESGISNLRMHSTCKYDVVRRAMKKVVEGNELNVEDQVFDSRSLHSFLEEFHDIRAEIVRVDPLLYYYAQQGYLTIVDRSNFSVKLKIPNEEVRNMFVKALTLYFVDIYRINRAMIDTCANLFRSINLSDENECKMTVYHIGKVLQTMCNQGDYKRSDLMNEALLEDLMFVLMYTAGFQPVTQTVVRQTAETYTILDVCSYRNTSRGAVIEFKINATAKIALDTIFEKGYTRELFQEWNLPFLHQFVRVFTGRKPKNFRVNAGEVLREYLPERHNFILMGVNLQIDKKKNNRGKHVLSIRYLRNSFKEEDEIEIKF